MFFGTVGHHIPKNQENEYLADKFFQQLGHLSLAVSAAAGIMVETGCNLADFIDLCEENDDRQTEPFAHLYSRGDGL
jgi:hypothetical protein